MPCVVLTLAFLMVGLLVRIDPLYVNDMYLAQTGT
jgi:hypothetical protein